MTVPSVLVAALAAGLAVSAAVSAAPAGASVPPPAICGISPFELNVIDTCFPPSKVGAAERQLGIRPVRPVRLVKRLTGLPLTHVMISKGHGRTGITYLSGRIPRTKFGFLDVSGTGSRYVLVAEGPGRGPFGSGKLIRNITPAGPAQAQDEVYWQYYDNFHCQDASLTVTSNQPGSLVRRIGRGLVSLERCGK